MNQIKNQINDDMEEQYWNNVKEFRGEIFYRTFTPISEQSKNVTGYIVCNNICYNVTWSSWGDGLPIVVLELENIGKVKFDRYQLSKMVRHIFDNHGQVDWYMKRLYLHNKQILNAKIYYDPSKIECQQTVNSKLITDKNEYKIIIFGVFRYHHKSKIIPTHYSLVTDNNIKFIVDASEFNQNKNVSLINIKEKKLVL